MDARARAAGLPVQGTFQRSGNLEDEKTRLHVALAQVEPSSAGTGAVDTVLARLEELAHAASERGADIIVFPEYFLTGATKAVWQCADKREPYPRTDVLPPWLDRVCAAARQLGIAIVTGSAVEPHLHPSRHGGRGLYNTAYLVDRRGDVQGVYTKRYLWHSERAVLDPATDETHDQPRLFTFETARGLHVRASMVMCWDLLFPESFRRLIHPDTSACAWPAGDCDWVGPDVVFAPTCWYANDSGPQALAWNPACEAACLDSVTVCRAMESECFVCMCNTAGAPPSDAAETPVGLGRSSCSAPLLGCSALVTHADETLLLHTLDMRVLHTARSIFHIRRDLKDAYESAQHTAKGGGDESFVIDTHSSEVPDLDVPARASDTHADTSIGDVSSVSHVDGLELPAHVAVVQSGADTAADGSPRTDTAAIDVDGDGAYEQLDAPPPTRYYDPEFGEDRRQKTVCEVCGEMGHDKKRCPYMHCLACGAVDEHTTRDCPLGTSCFRCGGVGHRSRDCTQRRTSGMRRMCERCGSTAHSETSCPSLWRIYAYNSTDDYERRRAGLAQHGQRQAERDAARKRKRTKRASGWAAAVVEPSDDSGPSDVPDDDAAYVAVPSGWDPAQRWCYNCARGGDHWGDDCVLRRRNPTRPTGDPSPFSGRLADSGPFRAASNGGSSRGAGRPAGRRDDGTPYARRDGRPANGRPPPSPPTPKARRDSHGAPRARPSLLDDMRQEDNDSDWFARRQGLRGQSAADGVSERPLLSRLSADAGPVRVQHPPRAVASPSASPARKIRRGKGSRDKSSSRGAFRPQFRGGYT
ncbi:hypothetical protein MSPP1_001029 [Malassezia sp. CBS 17886]|nr:hypothetical protein MSPP1_001029 [Malassezia sp. CBS 17886]